MRHVQSACAAPTRGRSARLVTERWDRLLRLVFVSPNMHRVHHSRLQPETDSNFSSVFSFWDRLAGTFRQRADPQGITFGLEGYDGEEWQSVRGLLRTPFVRSPEAARKRQTVDRARRRAGPAHTRRTPLL